MGTEISEADLENIQSLCDQVIALSGALVGYSYSYHNTLPWLLVISVVIPFLDCLPISTQLDRLSHTDTPSYIDTPIKLTHYSLQLHYLTQCDLSSLFILSFYGHQQSIDCSCLTIFEIVWPQLHPISR